MMKMSGSVSATSLTMEITLAPIAMLSVSEERIADDAMRPLAMIVRAARTAAVSAILQSAWH
jgi:hypothetical protein